MRITLLSLFCVLLIAGCSSTQEISKTTETIEIKPIKFDVPKVHGNIDLPLVKIDSLNNVPYGTYEGEKQIETPQADGTKAKATVKVKAQLKSDKDGKPYLDTELEIKQDSVKKQATIIKKTEQYEKKEETKGIYDTLKLFLYIILGIALLSVIGYLTNIFPKKN